MENKEEYRYPYIYYEIDPQRTVDLISELLIELVRRNDQNPDAKNSVTRFHSRSPPAIGIHEYLSRIVRYSTIENEVLLAALVYIDRISEVNPNFAITSLTVHRYMITAITVGSKVFCDSYCTNHHYAKVGGITINELNTLELEFSFLAQWKLIIPLQKIHHYYLGMLRESKRYHMIEYDTLIEPLPVPILTNEQKQQALIQRNKVMSLNHQQNSNDHNMIHHNNNIIQRNNNLNNNNNNNMTQHNNNHLVYAHSHNLNNLQQQPMSLPNDPRLVIPNPNNPNNNYQGYLQQQQQQQQQQIRYNVPHYSNQTNHVPSIQQQPIINNTANNIYHRPILPNIIKHNVKEKFTSTSPDDDSEENMVNYNSNSNNIIGKHSIAPQ